MLHALPPAGQCPNKREGALKVCSMAQLRGPHHLHAVIVMVCSLCGARPSKLVLAKIEWLEMASRLSRRSGAKQSLVKRLDKLVRMEKIEHDDHLLEHGYFNYRPSYEDIEGATIITNGLPYDSSLKTHVAFKKHFEYLQESQRNYSQLFFVNNRKELQSITDKFKYLSIKEHNVLCKGPSTELRPPLHDKDLKCVLLHRGDIYLKLGPFLFEELNLAPYIGRVLQFITQKESFWFMKHSHGRMKSTPYRVDGLLRDFSQKRTSKIRYIRDTKSEISTKVTERIRRLSGWKLEGRHLQITA